MLEARASSQVIFLPDSQAMRPMMHVREVLAHRSELQILCTTHAPYLLDRFQPEEVRVLSLNERGHTVARELTDHPEWSEQIRGLSTGEFWSSVGEQWVTSSGQG